MRRPVARPQRAPARLGLAAQAPGQSAAMRRCRPAGTALYTAQCAERTVGAGQSVYTLCRERPLDRIENVPHPRGRAVGCRGRGDGLVERGAGPFQEGQHR
ncbi:hypothetical protein EDE04_7031 [Streptomyces sp. 2132.2]|nr:hypothetical protein EDE04_7031 [Streptomyces sp. 2132.2]